LGLPAKGACDEDARQVELLVEHGAIVMILVGSRILAAGLASAAVLLLGAGPCLAGIGGPAPLVGVTGPLGIVAAGVAYGGYVLFRRYRSRS
jgi:hypothetical protein